jgi:hypothetical protein
VCLCVFHAVEKFFKGSLDKEERRFVEAVEATSSGRGRGDLRGLSNDPHVPFASQNMHVRGHHGEHGRVCRWVRGVESRGTCAY